MRWLWSLDKIQKKKITIMTFSNYRQESRPLFLSLELLNIYLLVTNFYLIAIFVHSYLHANLPSAFKHQFSTADYTICMYNTRSLRKLHINYKRTNYGKFSIKYKEHKLNMEQSTNQIKGVVFTKKNQKIVQQEYDFHLLDALSQI